ncbi:amidohydrolase family protein [Aeromicrobium sp. NPDC092404]|uniref:amidohydrolase family protein n=1 Tax=Aeromicrobium sp. NPDC092404 TaxID=3154976 RepID=UPI00342C0F13
MRTLLTGGMVMSLDPEIGILPRGELLIEDELIAAVGADLGVGDAQVVDVSGRILMPGFIDTHRHTWESVLRNIATDWQGSHYFSGVRGQLGRHFGAEEMYAANLVGALEALDMGITTIFDWAHCINDQDAADAAVAGLRDAGGRAVFGLGDPNDDWLPMSDVPASDQVARHVRETWFPHDDGLVTMAMSPRGPEFTTRAVVEHDMALARELDLKMSIHVGNGDRLPANHGPVTSLHDWGLLADDILFVHCNASSDEELRLIRDAGCRPPSVTVDSESHFGLGWPAVLRLMELGLRPSLGIDIVINSVGDMFGAMRSTAALTRAMQHAHADAMPDRLTVTARDLLEMATVVGSRSLWMEDKIGTLTPGKQADLVVLRADTLHHAPLNNPYGAVALGSHAGDVESVYVAGKAVKRDGELVGVDVARLRRLAETACDTVFDRAVAAGADARRGGDWIPEPYVARTVSTT